MIAHLVLLQPKPELTADQKRAALEALAAAARNVPEIRRFRIGRRVKHGRPGYEQLAVQDYDFALIIEFDDVEGLGRYLAAPAHGALGHLFATATSAALAYDYEMADAADAAQQFTF